MEVPTGSGKNHPADIVILAIGVRPETALAKMAGIRSVVADHAVSPGDRVHDAVCGTGWIVRRYQRSGIRTVALELSLESLLYLKRQLPASNAVDVPV